MSKVFHCHYFFGQTFLVLPASCSHLSSQISAGWVLVHFNFHHYAANCFCGLFFNREADIATTKRLFLFTFLGLDNSGLSDPFAKIYICDQSRATQVNCDILDSWHFVRLNIPGDWRDPVPHLGRAPGVPQAGGARAEGGHQEDSTPGHHRDIRLWQGEANIGVIIWARITINFSSTKLSLSAERSPLQQCTSMRTW